ncbi:zinc transport system permease protein [Caldanaerobius fijiensis DSM 17918]|uniref:Zinc transport system permease protein n=1 Tax=Caldanaerobius fijiensis DSM 17918 TaxID=1121256 RepID=A0A1M4T6T3_9THEO|nr:zinc transport system permease protein [Caldanaerobius fijiensis DSM 17918]
MSIFSYDFMIRAFIAGAIISIIAPLVGNYLVLRRLSQMGDTLSHVALAGIAGGMLLGTNPTISSVIFVLLSSFGIEKLRKSYFRYSEISIAVVMSGGIALAVLLLSLAGSRATNVVSYLWGSIISVTTADIKIIIVLGIVVVITIVLIYKELLYIAFDEEAAGVSGIPISTINMVFTILVSITIAVSMKIVGALLVSALMVIPPAASLKIAKSFKQTLFYSILFSFISVFVGIIVSYYLNLSPGGTIVAIALLILGFTNILKPRL